MAVTDVSICNIALGRLGAESIVTLADDTKGAASCSERFDPCKKFILRRHKWNCATKRVLVDKPGTASQQINFTAVNYNGSGQVTYLANLTVGVAYYWTKGANDISVVSGNTTLTSSGFFIATVVDVLFNGTAGQAVTATFEKLLSISPAFGYSYTFPLPADWLRTIIVDDGNTPYSIEGTRILSDNASLELSYIYNVTDYSTLDAAIVEAIAAYLAWDISYRMTQSSTLKTTLWDEYQKQLRAARTPDAQENFREELEANYFLEARVLPNDPAIPKRDWPS